MGHPISSQQYDFNRVGTISKSSDIECAFWWLAPFASLGSCDFNRGSHRCLFRIQMSSRTFMSSAVFSVFSDIAPPSPPSLPVRCNISPRHPNEIVPDDSFLSLFLFPIPLSFPQRRMGKMKREEKGGRPQKVKGRRKVGERRSNEGGDRRQKEE